MLNLSINSGLISSMLDINLAGNSLQVLFSKSVATPELMFFVPIFERMKMKLKGLRQHCYKMSRAMNKAYFFSEVTDIPLSLLVEAAKAFF